MTTPITIKTKARFHRGRRGSKVLKLGEAATPAPRRGRVPRVARLFALAHRFETSIRESEVRDYADLGHATRARVTQFMNGVATHAHGFKRRRWHGLSCRRFIHERHSV